MNKNELTKRMDGVNIVEIPSENKNIWEVSHGYGCPLIGLCFNAEEHRRILKKTGFHIKGMKLYKVHSVIMRHLYNKNKVSIKVNNYLKHKYRNVIEEFGGVSERRLQEEWLKRLEIGGFDGLFYLACIRRDLSEKLLEDMFGEIHMLSHAGVNAISGIKHELNEQRKTNEKLMERLKNQKQLFRESKRENKTTLRSLTLASNKLEVEKNGDLKARQEEYCDIDEVRITRTQAELCKIQKQNEQLTKELRQSQKEVTALTKQLNENKVLSKHLQGDIEELISHFSLIAETDLKAEKEESSKQDLESKKVLIVGGMTKIKHLYQHMIEVNGGYFEYHDGCMKNGHQNLDAKVGRSDIIICPVNCNSHNACNRVKRLCQKYKKPLKILSNASVSSISTALFDCEAKLNSQYL